jgi:hypothetical protein
MNKRQVCTLLVGLAAVAGPALGQNLVTNGSFEDPAYSNPVNYPVPVTGWTIGPDSGFEVWRGYEGPAADGAQYLELDVTQCNTISQTFPTVSGTRYTVRYAFSARPGVSSNRVDVRWNGQLISSANADGSGISQTAWTYYSTMVEATTTSTTLTLTDVDGCSGVGSLLDDVSVTEVEPIPALGGGGLLALAALLAIVGCLVLWSGRSLRG